MRIILLAFTLNVVVNVCFGQTIKSKEYQPAIRKATEFILALQSRLEIPGISVCVGNSRKTLWAQAFGIADLEHNTPVTTASKFRIGSVSKCLASLAVGKLFQEGRLALDTPIQIYVPRFPVKNFPITIRQLAGHTAGIRHYRDNETHYPVRYKSVEEGLALFEKDSLLFEPGTAYSYSTYAYTLISAAIETASGTPYLTYIQREILSPLKMHHTAPDYADSIIPGRVRFYDDYGGGLVNARLVDNSYKWAGGGYLSTPSDLVAMGRELLTHNLFTAETIKTLLTRQLLKNGTRSIAGIAWRVEADSKGRPIIHHGGAIEGGRTFLIVFPEQDLIIAICANKGVAPAINKGEMEIIADFFLTTSFKDPEFKKKESKKVEPLN